MSGEQHSTITAQSIQAQETEALEPLLDGQFSTILDVFHYAMKDHSELPAFSNLGLTLKFCDIKHYTRDFAAWIQHKTTLIPGDRIHPAS